MRGNKDGDPTTTYIAEEDYEAAIIEREAAAFLTGKTDERIRVASETLGIPFASLAERVSQSLAIQGKRSAMSLLQVRRDTARTSNVLQPEVALAGRSHRLLPGKGETERAGSGHTHQGNQPVAPDIIREVQQRAKDGQSVNSIRKRLNLTWLAVKNIITGEGPAKPNTLVASIGYQQQRQISSAYHTALKNGTPLQAVADRYKLSMYVVKKIYNKFDWSGVPTGKYAPVKAGLRIGKGGRPAPKAALVPAGRHKLTGLERNRLAVAVARAIEKGGPAIRRIADSYHVSWFTAREAYQQKYKKDLPKGGVVKKPKVEEPKAMAATA